MPNIKSAIKRMRSDARKQERNQVALAELKTLRKRLTQLAEEPKKAAEFATTVISRYDKAVVRGIIPRRRADRNKSRIEKFLQNIKKK